MKKKKKRKAGSLDSYYIYSTTILHEINEKDPYKCSNIKEYEHEFIIWLCYLPFLAEMHEKKWFK